MTAARYLRRLALAVLLLVAALAGLNYHADPYGVWRYGLLGDSIKSRPAIRSQERLHKAHAVRLADADCLILGNSRALLGLDPNHPALPANTYNLGMGAADIYECYRYLQHATALKKPKLVLFAIDKGMFNADSPTEAGFDENRLAVAADGTPQPRWRWVDLPRSTLSIDALRDSVKALLDKSGVKYRDGLRDESLMKPYEDLAKVLAENERMLQGPRKFSWRNKFGQNPQCDAFTKIIELCRKQTIELRIFTNPIHVETLEFERECGGFEEWARWVTETLKDHSPAFRNFYHYRLENSLPFLPSGKGKSATEEYWEISHYRKAVGDRVISEVMKNSPEPEGNWLETLEAERAKWKETR